MMIWHRNREKHKKLKTCQKYGYLNRMQSHTVPECRQERIRMKNGLTPDKNRSKAV